MAPLQCSFRVTCRLLLALQYSDNGYRLRKKGQQNCIGWRVSIVFHQYKDIRNTFKKTFIRPSVCTILPQITDVLMNLPRNPVSKYSFSRIAKMEGEKKVVKCLPGSIYKLNQRYCSKFTAGHLFFFSYFFSISNEGLTSKVKLSLLMRHC